MIKKIKVKAKSSVDLVEDCLENPDIDYIVKTRALPDKGQANQAVIRLLAKHLGLKKWQISIKSGQTSSIKLIKISN